ncbi:hypothetical protein AKJ16_DCAP20274 [Drosera capensis]
MCYLSHSMTIKQTLCLPSVIESSRNKPYLKLWTYHFLSACPRKMSSLMGSRKRRSHACRFLPVVVLLCAAVYIGSAYVVTDYQQDDSRPCGTEALPKGIIASTSDLEMRPLWGSIPKKKSSREINLLALAVGIKQKANVNRIVKKFLSSNFVVMLFHYDGNVNGWTDVEWSSRAIHVSAFNQTKWWFAKRFLHPDIVHEYSFIFLWDEDLGVQNFDVRRYLSIIKKEGLEISQPALDPDTSEVHHPLTARKTGSVVHRSINQPLRHGKRCDEHSTGPPCSGMVYSCKEHLLYVSDKHCMTMRFFTEDVLIPWI